MNTGKKQLAMMIDSFKEKGYRVILNIFILRASEEPGSPGRGYIQNKIQRL